MHKDRESQSELVPVEGALRLSYNNRIKRSSRSLEFRKQSGSSRPTLPRNGTGLPDIKKLGDDLAMRIDERFSSHQLPVSGGVRILLIFSRNPAGKGKFYHLGRNSFYEDRSWKFRQSPSTLTSLSCRSRERSSFAAEGGR
nr:hypothetical protein [Streptomyces sp. NRRL F-5917]